MRGSRAASFLVIDGDDPQNRDEEMRVYLEARERCRCARPVRRRKYMSFWLCICGAFIKDKR